MIARRWLAVLAVMTVLAVFTWAFLVPVADLAVKTAYITTGGVVYA